MVRVLLFLVLIAALAFGFAWMADQPGTVTIRWLGHNVELEVLTGVIAVTVTAIVVMLLIGFVKWLLASPTLAGRFFRRRRAEKGRKAVEHGIVAIGAGDRRAAERHAAEAEKLAPGAPLTLLLRAQAAQLAGDRSGAEQAFRAMIDKPETRVLGLRGLYVEAQRRGDAPAARAIAEEAAKVSQSAAWASQAVLEHRTVAGDWDGALASVERQYAAKVIDRDTAKRQRAVLLTAKALETEDRDAVTAKRLVLEAQGLAPGLVPAAALAGRLLAHDGDTRKAAKIIEAAWKLCPHPDLAEAYSHARHGDSRLDELKRVQYLARLTPSHPEGLMAVMRAAIDAGDFAMAHRALEELESQREAGQPSQRACLLAAELAAKEDGDHGRAREWMARALRAPRDPVWTADGQVSDVWLPASPLTGRLDAFQWKVPVAEIGGPLLQVDDVLADAYEAPQPAPVIEAIPEPIPTPPAEPVVEAAPPPAPEPEATAPPSASAPSQPEILPPEPAPAPPRPRPSPTETVFPMARAPDDPGPKVEPGRKASFFGG